MKTEHRLLCPTADFAALGRSLGAASPEKELLVEVTSAAAVIAAARAGFDVIQAEKFAPEAIAQVIAAVHTSTPRPLVAGAAGINPDNAAAYARAGADVLVTSSPYTAGPADVAVNLMAR